MSTSTLFQVSAASYAMWRGEAFTVVRPRAGAHGRIHRAWR
jgi:hypothetical protein